MNKLINFLYSISLAFLFFNNLKAQDGILFGSACHISSAGSCNILSYAVKLTNENVPAQFGAVRLPGKQDINKGIDGQICLFFGSPVAHNKEITFSLQLDTLIQDKHDSCNIIPRPNYPYFNQIQNFFAIKFVTKQDNVTLGITDEIIVLQKNNGVESIIGAYQAPFDLENNQSIPIRIVYSQEGHRAQLYLSEQRIFDICIDLKHQVFKDSSFINIVMTGQTDNEPDRLIVSVLQAEYVTCPIGNCKVKDSEFHNWIQAGPGKNSQWHYKDTTQVLTQIKKDYLSFFLDPCTDWINIKTSFIARVDNMNDDGYFGFVWGWEDLFCQDSFGFKGNIFGWRRKDLPYPANNSFIAEAGRIFARMNGNIPPSNLPGGISDHFWANNQGNSWQWIQPPDSEIWNPYTEYLIELEYTSLSTKIWIDSLLILDVNAPLGQPNKPGQFGFYTFEQEGVSFKDVKYIYLDKINFSEEVFCTGVTNSLTVSSDSPGSDYSHIQSLSLELDNIETTSQPYPSQPIFFQYDEPGQHTLSLTLHTNFNDCDLHINQPITVKEFDPPILPTDTVVCPYEVLYIDQYDHNDPNAIFTWQNGSNLNAYVGTYPETIWVEKIAGDSACRSRDTMILDFHTTPVITFVVQSACKEQNNGQLIGSATGSSAPFTFQFQGQSFDSLDFRNLLPGLDELIITDQYNCIFEEAVYIEEAAQPIINLQVADVSCYGKKDGHIIIAESPDNVKFSLNGYDYTDNKSFPGLDTGFYIIYYQDFQGCVYTDSAYIEEPPSFSINIHTPKTVGITAGDSVQLNTIITPDWFSLPVVWHGIGNSCDTCDKTSVILEKSSRFIALITDSTGCTAADTVFLYVNNDLPVYVANIFSPNGDGENDRVWVCASPSNIKQVIVWQIYHRGGGRIFERTNFQPNDPAISWDGVFRGKLLNPDVFVYILEVMLTDGRCVEKSGTITLVR